MILVPETLEIRSRALKTRIMPTFQYSFEPRNQLIGSADDVI